MFGATPACTAPQTSDMPCRGSARRDSRPGTSVITRPSAYTRSTVRCGRAVCPPGPDSSTSTLSQAAVIGPVRRPTRPVSSFGSQCSAKIRSTSLSTPPSIASSAPPGTASSAGWKITRTRPAQLRSGGQREGGAEHRGRVRIVTAGVADARHGRRVRHVLDVLQRQRVDVRAQRDDPLAGADVAVQARTGGQDVRLQAGRRTGPRPAARWCGARRTRARGSGAARDGT